MLENWLMRYDIYFLKRFGYVCSCVETNFLYLAVMNFDILGVSVFIETFLFLVIIWISLYMVKWNIGMVLATEYFDDKKMGKKID